MIDPSNDLWICLWCVELQESASRSTEDFFKKIWEEETFQKRDARGWEKNLRHWLLLTNEQIYQDCNSQTEDIRPCNLVESLGLDRASTLGPGDLTVDA